MWAHLIGTITRIVVLGKDEIGARSQFHRPFHEPPDLVAGPPPSSGPSAWPALSSNRDKGLGNEFFTLPRVSPIVPIFQVVRVGLARVRPLLNPLFCRLDQLDF